MQSMGWSSLLFALRFHSLMATYAQRGQSWYAYIRLLHGQRGKLQRCTSAAWVQEVGFRQLSVS